MVETLYTIAQTKAATINVIT